MSADKCVFCNEKLEGKTVNVSKKGIKTICNVSKLTRDGLHINIQREDSITVHAKCRRDYTRSDNVEAKKRKLDQGLPIGDTGSTSQPPQPPPTPKKKVLRRAGSVFSFKTHCLYCGRKADPQAELKKRKEFRCVISKVETFSILNSIKTLATSRNSEQDKAILRRIAKVSDLVAEEAIYHQSCQKKFNNPVKQPKGTYACIEDSMNKIYEILENSNDVQFSLSELVENVKPAPNVKTIKSKLTEKYGNRIIFISGGPHREPTIIFKHAAEKILVDSWYSTLRDPDHEKEKLRIIRAAGDIILEDITSKVYSTDSYPAPDDFLKDVETDIPNSLTELLRHIMLKNRKNPESTQKKSTAIAHCIISAIRPRSFHSPLLVGIAANLHSKFGSRYLIDILSSLGFCASYAEVKLFLSSSINYPKQLTNEEIFVQYVYDNADHNTRTINGYDTFHAMGGIQCLTPKPLSSSSTPIVRVKSVPCAELVGKFGEIPFHTYSSTVKHLDIKIDPVALKNVQFSIQDFAWLTSKFLNENSTGWSGFMSEITKNFPYQLSEINFLPFINSIPSDYDTIYTALQYAISQTKEHGQKLCVVTFDQPLYIKARSIICNVPERDIQIFVRLGGFHTILSFLGAIGFIMSGSGLKEALCEIFAQNSVEKLLSGHAYSRAMRGHFLMHEVLGKIIMAEFDISEEDRRYLEPFFTNSPSSPEIASSKIIAKYFNIFNEKLLEISNRGKTSKLWTQYFNMITLLKTYVRAERAGEWQEHLHSTAAMLPYFHASGHFLYAKSAHLYLQDALALTPEFAKLMADYFTIRRSKKFWSGIPTDMSIEQTLMKSMKSVGGLTHGRGVTDNVLKVWTLSRPVSSKITEAVEEFCDCTATSSEQHLDLRTSSIKRDEKAASKLLEWFKCRNPFPKHDPIVSLSSGLAGDASVNCHLSFETGKSIMESVTGKTFGDVSFKRANRVTPLSSMTSVVKIHDDKVPVDPLLIFQRITLAKKNDDDLKSYFSYELAPFPLAIFSETGMRKTEKSKLYSLFSPLPVAPDISNSSFVIDGGFMLHRIPWPKDATFDFLCLKYVDYLKNFKSDDVTVVFDGYENSKESTKNPEHIRRITTAGTSADIEGLTGKMSCSVPQNKFLNNDKNKIQFIELLGSVLKAHNIKCLTADGDADILIIETAKKSLGEKKSSTVIVGTDTDLIVYAVALSDSDSSLIFMKPGTKKMETKYFSIQNIKKEIHKYILFLHIFTGCDTTSCFHRKGKIAAIKILTKNLYLETEIAKYYDKNSTVEEIIKAGEMIIVALYGGCRNDDLNDYRFKCFAKSLKKTATILASIPPTKAAAAHHSKRVFLEVQHALGNILPPTDFGWRTTSNGLMPVTTDIPAAPDDILFKIFCSCTKGCGKLCGCRKSGLLCNFACAHCEGDTCTNKSSVEDIDENEEDDYDDDKIQPEKSKDSDDDVLTEENDDDSSSDEDYVCESDLDESTDSDTDDFEDESDDSDSDNLEELMMEVD